MTAVQEIAMDNGRFLEIFRKNIKYIILEKRLAETGIGKRKATS